MLACSVASIRADDCAQRGLHDEAMRMLLLAVVPFLVFALVSSSSSESSTAPSRCARTDRVGTYLLEFRTLSGNCGDIASGLTTFTSEPPPPAPGAPACTLNAETWSENDCKLERDLTCPAKPSGTSRLVAVTRATTADSGRLEGTATFSLSGTGNDCTGTYAVVATRQ
jgi:hypothetical protein